MDILKKLPIKYKGELHEVCLINFSVEKEEVLPFVPEGLQVRDFGGRALISMVNVKLRRMRPGFFPDALHFQYQHIGFRLLVNDSKYNNGEAKGIYFLRSFTDKPLIVQGGSWFTNYKLERAKLQEKAGVFELIKGANYLKYKLTTDPPTAENAPLKEMVGALDRAYSFIGNELVRVRIMRERWPIEWINCQGFETNFFLTARLEGAFRVQDVIHYEWLPAKTVKPCA